MEANKEEALKAKEIAEKRFFEKDFAGAKNYALKAKALYPGMEGISQMVATFEVYVASEVKSNGEADYYSILGLKPFADKEAVKKQYRKMAVMLHPDKNKCVGADGAFKLVSEAWTLLSDNAKRKSYDHQRNKQSSTVVNQTNLSSVHASGVVAGFNNCSNSSASHGRLDTFWTVCTSCKVQYEYLRKYVNKRLSCKNCRGVFIAVETGTAPANGSFPYAPWSYAPGNGYAASHGYDGVTYVPSNTTFYAGNGVSGFHSGHGFEYVSNVSFQWSSFSGTSVGVMGPTGPSSMGHDAIYHAHGNVNVAAAKVKTRSNGKRAMKNVGANGNSNPFTGCIESPGSKVNGPDKRRKLTVGASFRNGYHENVPKSDLDAKLENGNASSGLDRKLSSSVEVPNRRCSAAPAFDARKLLIDKARTEILKKLEEIKLVSAAEAAVKKSKVPSDQAVVAKEASKRVESNGSDHQLHGSKTAPLSITVPDSDFHDFDKDRSEESFKPKQIWALYDEEDGMPRLYCLIREVISVKPFKILITYLSSKTDSEFGSVNWLDCGFTKSCGNFRAYNSDVVDQVNVFSHLLSREKAGRGGCVRIYPRSGDIWAVYRNWSPDWDRSTPDEVRHQYEMVEVLDDYSEELGCCVSPLVKVTGFKTVYGRSSDKDAIRWIPRREMVRFSHQVPSWLLKGEENNLPEKCWDLDPAATPDELLHAAGAGEAEA